MNKFLLFIISLGILLIPVSDPIAAPISQQALDVPFYSQRDELWGDNTLGISSLKIKDEGCAVTSAAMVLRYYGIQTIPGTLNNALKENKGFSGALLWWGNDEAWSQATDGIVKGVTQYWYNNEKALKANLDNERPVVVFLNGDHYVVATGYREFADPNDPDKIITEYTINDPWAVSAEDGKNIRMQDNLLKITSPNITQMNILHTDPEAPVDGPLVDWPEISEKYLSLGGVEGALENPLSNDVYSTASAGYVEIRSQAFEGGQIHVYRFGGWGDWHAYWMPEKIAQSYNLDSHGLLLGDMYAVDSGMGSFLERVDAESASLIHHPTTGEVDIFNAENGIKAEYFDNQELNGEPWRVRFEESINFNWADGPPHPDLGNAYAVRFTQKVSNALPWWFTFMIRANGGIRSQLGGDELHDQWHPPLTGTSKITHWMWAGDHEWAISYKNSAANPAIEALFTAWPAGIVWAEGEALGSFERLPQTAPPIGDDLLEDIAPPPENAIVIDDQSPAFRLVGAEGVWAEDNAGYDDHFYWIVSNRSTSAAGEWSIEVPDSREYDLFAYIPLTHASTQSARYFIRHAGQQSQVIIDQAFHTNSWVHLGTFDFNAEDEAFVSLGSQTEDAERSEVALDAVAFLPGAAFGEAPGQDWWEKIELWYQELIENLEQLLNEIIETGQRNLQEEIERLLRELEARFLAWLQDEFEQFVQDLCLPAMMLPMWVVLCAAYFNRRRTTK